MKIAHKLRSAEHISKKELQRVLAGSLHSTKFQVEPHQMEQMIDGIMKVSTGLTVLVQELQLYISYSTGCWTVLICKN